VTRFILYALLGLALAIIAFLLLWALRVIFWDKDSLKNGQLSWGEAAGSLSGLMGALAAFNGAHGAQILIYAAIGSICGTLLWLLLRTKVP
jgi:hypothetical protein